jgi:hypothetical protein
MDSLLARLKAGTANRVLTKWLGTDIDIELRVLNDQDYLDAGLAVDQIYRGAKLEIAMQNIRDYEGERATQMLYRAVCDPSTHGPFTGDIREFRRLLIGQGVKEQLISELELLHEKCSPRVAAMADGELDALLLQVKKTPGTTLLNVSSISMLRRLMQCLVAERAISPTGSGSIS